MKKEYDFSRGKKVDPKRVLTDPKIMISLRLEPRTISLLKDEADALGIGYQTLIGDILKKHIEPKNVSFEDKLIERIMKRLEESSVSKKKNKKKKTA